MTWVQGKLTPIQSNGTTATLTFGSTVGHGNTVVGAVASTGALGNVPTIVDDKSNSYPIVDAAANNGTVSTYALSNITNAPKVITITWGTAVGFPQVVADEYSGISGVDGTAHAIHINTNPGTGTDAITSGNITTSGSDTVWGVVTNMSNASLTNSGGTGFTVREQDTVVGNWSIITEDKVQSSAGTTAATFTDSVGTAAFIAAAVGLSPNSSANGGCCSGLPLLGVGSVIWASRKIAENPVVTRRGLILPRRLGVAK